MVLPTSDQAPGRLGPPLMVTMALASVSMVFLEKLVVGHSHTTFLASTVTEPAGAERALGPGAFPEPGSTPTSTP